ncbi:hypothetical protein H5T87_08715 [bacterium]|nr:hypothetical protein [bacterium]
MKGRGAFVSFVLLLTQITSVVIYGQSLPLDVATLLQKVDKKLSGKAIEITYIEKGYWVKSKKPCAVPKEVKILWEPKGKFVCHQKSKEKEFLYIYDGKTFWIYRVDKKLYNSRPSKNYGERLKGFFLRSLIPPSKAELKKMLNECEKEGIEARISLKQGEFKGKQVYIFSINIKGDEERRIASTQNIYWLDAKTYLPLFAQTIFDNDLYEYEFKKFLLNPPIPKNAFKFSPPKDAREVSRDEIFSL